MGYSDTDEEEAAKAALENVSPGRSGATGHGTGIESPGVNNVMRRDGGAKVLPFVFKALEDCLESACRCLESEEDYINIMLDEKQNQLLQMGVMLSTATLVVAAGVSIVGLFGMNITIDIYNDAPRPGFWETTIGTVVGCIVLYIIAIGWFKKSRLS